MVLVAGGDTGSNVALSTAELYNPSTGTWSSTGAMATARESHTATLLPNGKVIVAGGFNPDPFFTIFASAEIYDPSTGSWSSTGAMGIQRFSFAAVLLSSGRVLVEGGFPDVTGTRLASAELYDPVAGTWSPTASLAIGRDFHTATKLANGQVLVAGGGV